MIRAAFAATLSLVVVTGTVDAQPSRNRRDDPRAERAKELKAARDRYETEKEYNEMLKRTRPTGPAPKTDPWSGVRSGGETGR